MNLWSATKKLSFLRDKKKRRDKIRLMNECTIEFQAKIKWKWNLSLKAFSVNEIRLQRKRKALVWKWRKMHIIEQTRAINAGSETYKYHSFFIHWILNWWIPPKTFSYSKYASKFANKSSSFYILNANVQVFISTHTWNGNFKTNYR